jgi:hypothetical protein
MRREIALFVPLFLIAAACGSDSGLFTDTGGETSGTVTSTGSDDVELECPEPVAVDDVQDIVDVLAGMDWIGYGPYSSGPLPISPDLIVTGTVEMTSADVPVPQSCLDRDDCLDEATFSGSGLTGVSFEGEPESEYTFGFTSMTITDTTIRLRPYMQDRHPSPFNSVPIVSVRDRCGAPCGEGSALCPIDGTCYAFVDSDAYCTICEQRPVEECICRTPEGPVPDGESCEYFISGDVIITGTCRDGVCLPEG